MYIYVFKIPKAERFYDLEPIWANFVNDIFQFCRGPDHFPVHQTVHVETGVEKSKHLRSDGRSLHIIKLHTV